MKRDYSNDEKKRQNRDLSSKESKLLREFLQRHVKILRGV